jgi:anthranilate/para-aminobenzoate synthase component I
VRTSLPREAYLRSVRRIRQWIFDGEIYQANLCQRFEGTYVGDELALYGQLVHRSPAPLSAFVDTGDLALASVSPEIFIRVDPADLISTHPIKGTRPRGADPEEDRLRREELLASAKDRAELLMIVDLERNDLGRICRTGTVVVPELARLRSYAQVHHLVARVEGRLQPGTGPGDWIGATFPGGSITGAPKIRAMELLEELEPARRSFFTGSLFWFGDDGRTDSSILIRTLELRRGRFYLGAGGGVVADSDPEGEWMESNHKIAALAAALSFDPEEAR